MRLLSIETLQLETFVNESAIPPFAILSHTWGHDEVTLQDLQLPPQTLALKRGWQKITRFRDAVTTHAHLLAEPVEYLWVDTVCIDKTSSAEMTEAINSMFRWYRNAVCCLALLGDVVANDEKGVGDDFEASRWFTRGWTLQELLAPREVHFFDKNWQPVGSKADLVDRISKRTNIVEEIILTGEWPFATVAQRMSWMTGRVTTRLEDIAYCLLGIFDVNMPMLYGEGERAFIRLQEEIIKESDDESIFAWDASDASTEAVGVLATHPRQFSASATIESLPSEAAPFVLTNKGLQITLPIIEREEDPGQKIALLSCSDAKDASSLIGIKIRAEAVSRAKCTRMPGPPVVIPVRDGAVFWSSMKSVYLAKRDGGVRVDNRPLKCHLQGTKGPLSGLEFIGASPADSWHHSKANTLTMAVPRVSAGDETGMTSTLLFRLEGRESTVCLVMSINPATRLALVGLVLGPNKPPEGEALDTALRKLKESAAPIADRESAELVIGKEKVSVRMSPGGTSVIRVTLARYWIDGLKFFTRGHR